MEFHSNESGKHLKEVTDLKTIIFNHEEENKELKKIINMYIVKEGEYLQRIRDIEKELNLLKNFDNESQKQKINQSIINKSTSSNSIMIANTETGDKNEIRGIVSEEYEEISESGIRNIPFIINISKTNKIKKIESVTKHDGFNKLETSNALDKSELLKKFNVIKMDPPIKPGQNNQCINIY